MKTVMDAVNEFKGELSARDLTESCDQIIVAMGNFGGYERGHIDVGSGNRSNCTTHWRCIGTFEEFNQCVQECETNFGRCSISFSEHCSNESVRLQEGNKIDWSQAPEGAEYYGHENDCYGAGWYKDVNNNAFTVWPVSHGKWHVSIGNGGCISDRNLIPKPQPVFTQEFRVLGGSSEVWQKCKIVFVGKRYTVVENENGKEFSRKTAKIKIRNIDTRTDKEKAIEMAITNLMFYGDQTQTSQKANETLIAIMENKIHGVKWVGE